MGRDGGWGGEVLEVLGEGEGIKEAGSEGEDGTLVGEEAAGEQRSDRRVQRLPTRSGVGGRRVGDEGTRLGLVRGSGWEGAWSRYLADNSRFWMKESMSASIAVLVEGGSDLTRRFRVDAVESSNRLVRHTRAPFPRDETSRDTVAICKRCALQIGIE